MLLSLCHTTKKGDVRAHFSKLRRVVYEEVILTQFT